MNINRWDNIMVILLTVSVVLTVAAPRMRANLVQGRYILDFETEMEEGDEVFLYETADAEMLVNIGWFNLLSNVVFAVLLVTIGLIATKIVHKAGWFRTK